MPAVPCGRLSRSARSRGGGTGWEQDEHKILRTVICRFLEFGWDLLLMSGRLMCYEQDFFFN